jgi:hypothetical protein
MESLSYYELKKNKRGLLKDTIIRSKKTSKIATVIGSKQNKWEYEQHKKGSQQALQE